MISLPPLPQEPPGCRKCGGTMQVGRAIVPTWAGTPDDLGGGVVTMASGGPGRLVPCLKCVSCGWSVTP